MQICNGGCVDDECPANPGVRDTDEKKYAETAGSERRALGYSTDDDGMTSSCCSHFESGRQDASSGCPTSSTNRYTATGYRVDYVTQSRLLDRDVMIEQCFPCCGVIVDDATDCERRRRRPRLASFVSRLWLAFRSELVLCGLHFTAILLETIKDGIEPQRINVDNQLYLIHSIVETGAILLLIALRLTGAYLDYRSLLKTLSLQDDIDDCQSVSSYNGRHAVVVRRWLVVLMVIGTSIGVGCVAGFATLFFYSRLDCTILSNNVAPKDNIVVPCLRQVVSYLLEGTSQNRPPSGSIIQLSNNVAFIAITAVSTLYRERISATEIVIKHDYFKVAINDSASLLEKLSRAILPATSDNTNHQGDQQEDGESVSAAHKYLEFRLRHNRVHVLAKKGRDLAEAIRQTPAFKLPSYIHNDGLHRY